MRGICAMKVFRIKKKKQKNKILIKLHSPATWRRTYPTKERLPWEEGFHNDRD